MALTIFVAASACGGSGSSSREPTLPSVPELKKSLLQAACETSRIPPPPGRVRESGTLIIYRIPPVAEGPLPTELEVARPACGRGEVVGRLSAEEVDEGTKTIPDWFYFRAVDGAEGWLEVMYDLQGCGVTRDSCGLERLPVVTVPPLHPEGQPDLVAQTREEQEKGDPCRAVGGKIDIEIDVVLVNLGQATSPSNIELEWTKQENVTGFEPEAHARAGSVYQLGRQVLRLRRGLEPLEEFRFSPPAATKTPNPTDLGATLMVDPKNSIPETNEDNNKLRVPVKGGELTCVPRE